MKRLFATLLLLILIGCSSTTTNEITVSDIWGRSSPMVVENGAFYLTVTNGTEFDDAIVAADSLVCKMTELHTGFVNEDGTMGMHHVDKIDVPAGETVMLEPGGLHVMCMGMTEEFVEGAVFDIELTFEDNDAMVVSAEIQSAVAEGMNHNH